MNFVAVPLVFLCLAIVPVLSKANALPYDGFWSDHKGHHGRRSLQGTEALEQLTSENSRAFFNNGRASRCRMQHLDFSRCRSHRHAYGAAWLATSELFMQVEFHLNTKLIQLEMASHDMFNTAEQALKTLCVSDFFVEHLSAFGRHVKNGKDDQNKQAVVALHTRARETAEYQCAEDRVPLSKLNVCMLVPFFTGSVPSTGPHSFGSAEERAFYLQATLCSLFKHFTGHLVVGVCTPTSEVGMRDKEVAQDVINRLRSKMDEIEVEVVEVDCSEMTNNLPNQVLLYGQKLYREKFVNKQLVVFTESDQVFHFSSTAVRNQLFNTTLSGKTYISPYRLEESYHQRTKSGVKTHAARVKDTTGPVIKLEGGREYTVANFCSASKTIKGRTKGVTG